MSEADGVTLRGGCYIGNSYWSSSVFSWPLVTLTIYADRLDVAGKGLIPFLYTFRKTEITQLIVRGRNVLSGATVRLQIVHKVTDIPPYVVFGTFAVDKLLTGLASNGFEYTEVEAVPLQTLITRIKPYLLALGAFIAIAMSILFRWRMLGFLRDDTLISGGRTIQTGVFASIVSLLFLILGVLSAVILDVDNP